MSSRPVRLLCCADDFGISPERDAGIARAIDDGIVTHTSVIVNGTSFASHASTAIAVQTLTARRERVTIGLHLNLTEFEPCAVLAADDGVAAATPLAVAGRFRGKLPLLAVLNELDARHVELELRAQLRRFSELFDGALPAHLDGHNHVHLFAPVRDVVARVAAELNIKRVRLPIESLADDGEQAPQQQCVDALRLQLSRHATPLDSMPVQSNYNRVVLSAAAEAMPLFQAHGLSWCDAFVGLELPLRCQSVESARQHIVERLERVLASPSALESVELMCHPGLRAPESASDLDAFAKSADRETELEALITMRNEPIMKRFDRC
jgi:predicted glycoside hydrolase/deacetylase ChbG (UPF0249 family)